MLSVVQFLSILLKMLKHVYTQMESELSVTEAERKPKYLYYTVVSLKA